MIAPMSGQPRLVDFTSSSTVRVEPRPAVGHNLRSAYVETFWLPVIGPTSIALVRHLGIRFAAQRAGLDLDLAECAAALGVGAPVGRNSPINRTLNRLVQFDVAVLADDRLLVRTALPEVSFRHLERFTPSMRAAHSRYLVSTGGEGRNLSSTPEVVGVRPHISLR